mmetsp:Transcript_86283/g.192907  ORF Transcript_86283/g.192907 Transcript_86283/m.192907 type:complete len:115 (+) Transcript_86283:102-446(+)
MQPQCFGQCLPRFTGHPGGAPGGFCDDPQDAFYESEIARMKEEVARLRDTNKALNKELAEQETGDEEDEEEEKFQQSLNKFFVDFHRHILNPVLYRLAALEIRKDLSGVDKGPF